MSEERIIQLEEEVERLKDEINRLNQEKDRLDEECDLLAEENERLRGLLANTNITVTPEKAAAIEQKESVQEVLFTEEHLKHEELEVFVDDPFNNYVNHSLKQIPNASSGKNVICTSFFTNEDIGDILFCGGVDAVLRGYDYHSGIELYTFKTSAPVLTIVCSKHCVACGMMDGSLLLVFIASPDSNPITITHKDHTKYCIALKWSSDGRYLASAGHDKVLNLYRNTDSGEIIKYQSIQFPQTPESLIFTTPINDSNEVPELIVGLRGLSSLVYLQIEGTFEQRQVSMNEKEWDTHVSFTPLYLSISPNQKYLLISTDKHMHIIVRLGTNQRVRVLTGHACGDYGKPMALWSNDGKYVYCNSEEEHTVYVYSIAKEKVVDKLRGHSGIIRGIAIHPIRNLLATASYDKSVIVWDQQNH